MRLRYLYLPDYGPLKEVAVVFEKNPHIDNRQGAVNFVVGLNGSGKSSLLRAIYDVFHSLSREELPKFPVTIAYDLILEGKNRTVLFHRTPSRASDSFIILDSSPIQSESAEEWQSHIERSTWVPDMFGPDYGFQNRPFPKTVWGDELKGNGTLRNWLPTRVLAYTSGDLDPWQAMAYPISPSDELPDPGSKIDRSAERPHGWDRHDESRHSDDSGFLDGGPVPEPLEASEDLSTNDRCFFLRPEDARLAAAAVGIWQAALELKEHADERQLNAIRDKLIAHLDDPKRPPVEGARRLLNELDWLLPTHVAFRFSKDTDYIPHPDHARLFWLFALSENVVAQPLGESLAVVDMSHRSLLRPEDLVAQQQLEPQLKRVGELLRNATSGAEALCALLDPQESNEEEDKPSSKPREYRLWSIFQTLRSWRSHGLLTDVQLTVKRIRQVKAAGGEPDDRILSYASFSDGEQMLLGRMAFLLLLRKQDNSLLLLDEPETHFNDAWKRQIIDMVDDSILKDTSAQVLVSTHTSLALTDVFSCEITRLVKDQGTTRAERLAHPTFGADPGRILLHVFGAPDVIGARAAEFLREKLRKEWEPHEIEKLAKLIDEIGSGWPRAKLIDLLDDLNSRKGVSHAAFDS
jgi:ABC-type transport system involved in cytochrome c biogenesis ATPase subunit